MSRLVFFAKCIYRSKTKHWTIFASVQRLQSLLEQCTCSSMNNEHCAQLWTDFNRLADASLAIHHWSNTIHYEQIKIASKMPLYKPLVTSPPNKNYFGAPILYFFCNSSWARLRYRGGCSGPVDASGLRQPRLVLIWYTTIICLFSTSRLNGWKMSPVQLETGHLAKL